MSEDKELTLHKFSHLLDLIGRRLLREITGNKLETVGRNKVFHIITTILIGSKGSLILNWTNTEKIHAQLVPWFDNRSQVALLAFLRHGFQSLQSYKTP